MIQELLSTGKMNLRWKHASPPSNPNSPQSQPSAMPCSFWRGGEQALTVAQEQEDVIAEAGEVKRLTELLAAERERLCAPISDSEWIINDSLH